LSQDPSAVHSTVPLMEVSCLSSSDGTKPGNTAAVAPQSNSHEQQTRSRSRSRTTPLVPRGCTNKDTADKRIDIQDSSSVSRLSEKQAKTVAHLPLLCVILGGPGSGKTTLGEGLHSAIPGLCHVSSGEVARLATSDAAPRSPLLGSIRRQLSDSRRRKAAHRRLEQVITRVLADGLRSEPSIHGLIVDGIRAAELQAFKEVLSSHFVIVLQIHCSSEVMLSRLQGRCRNGDERLDGSEFVNQLDGRIEAYQCRVKQDEHELRDHFQAKYELVVRTIDGSQKIQECIHQAQKAIRGAVHAYGYEGIEGLEIAEASTARVSIDWAGQLAETAARMDLEMHPDGRPRTT